MSGTYNDQWIRIEIGPTQTRITLPAALVDQLRNQPPGDAHVIMPTALSRAEIADLNRQLTALDSGENVVNFDWER